MTSQEFDNVLEGQLEECRGILASKGNDYTDGEDRLSNFKAVAALIGTTPEIVWAVYFMKHIIAILNYASRGQVESEPIGGRITDAINYLILFRALVEEEGGGDSEAPPPEIEGDTTERMLRAAGVDPEALRQLELPLGGPTRWVM